MSKKFAKKSKTFAVAVGVLFAIVIALVIALGYVTNWYRNWNRHTGSAEEPKTEAPKDTDEPTKENPEDPDKPTPEDPSNPDDPTKENPEDPDKPTPEDPSDTDEPKKETLRIGEFVVTEGTQGEGISLLISADESDAEKGAVQLQAVTPDYEGEITVNAAYTGEEVYWAGESRAEVEESIALTQTDSRTVRIESLAEFGTQIEITVTRTDTGEAATVLCDYIQTFDVTDISLGENRFLPNGVIRGAKLSDPVRLVISPDKAQALEYTVNVKSGSYTVAAGEPFVASGISVHFGVDETWLETFFPDDAAKSAFMEYSAEITGDGEISDFFDTAWAQYALKKLYPEQTLEWWFDFLWNKTVESEMGGIPVSIYIDGLPAYVLTVSWGETSYTYLCSFDLTELDAYVNE